MQLLAVPSMQNSTPKSIACGVAVACDHPLDGQLLVGDSWELGTLQSALRCMPVSATVTN